MTKPRRSLESRGKVNRITTASTAINRNRERKLEYHPEGDYYYGGIPFKITVTGKNKKKRPYWVSPKGAGNMTVMPGDPEMVFFAPIAAGAAITAAPAIGSVLGNTMTGINAAGDAVAATAAGQRLTSGLNFISKAVGNSKVWPWMDAGLTSAFAAHGLNHAINEGIDGWGDAAATAIEIAPLGRLTRPIYNAVKSTANFVPTIESNMAGIRYAYNRNPELANIGTLEDYNEYLKTVFPKSKVRDINYHMGPKGLQELKPSTGEIYNTNPNARGIYVTPDKSYSQSLRKYTTDRLEKPSAWTFLRRNLTPGGWDKANETFTDIYPVMIDTRNPLYTKGNWTWGIKDKKYQSLMKDYDAVVNSGPRWYQNFHSMPESIVPKTEQTLLLGSDADVIGFRKFMSSPNITAENAASITPEQWTTAQDAAIARGDMAEAQRLRDLHFKVSAPDTKIITDAGQPAHIYHGTDNVWTVYDPKKFNSATGDYGFYGIGLYGTESRPIAKTYGNKVFNLYVNAKKPFVTDLKSSVDRKSAMYWFNREIPSTARIPSEVKNYFGELNTSDAAINSNSLRKFDEVVIPNSNQIKLSNAITYDNNGVRIPLGKRDNFKLNDIRYALIPAIATGAAYGVNKMYLDEQRPQKRNGASIYIKPSKRGTFRAAASKHGMGVQEFASRVLANKEDYSSAMVKKANFARNASKWH